MTRLLGTGSPPRVDLALAALLIAAIGPFVQTLTAQGAARYSLTAAVVEQGTVRLDAYEATLGMDRVELDGHLYSDKAPAQPLLGVPVLAVAKALGDEPATAGRLEGNLGLWSQTLVFCTLPAAALIVLMRRHAARSVPSDLAILAAISLSFGTMLLPFSTALYGHMMATTLGFGAWHLLSRHEPSTGAVAAAGTLAALAVATEYPLGLASIILGIWVLWRLGFRSAVVFGVPHLAVGIGLVLYNSAVYGTAGSGYARKGDPSAITAPRLDNVIEMLVGAKGFIYTPIVIVGIIVLASSLRRRPALAVPAAMVVAYYSLQAGWPNPWGGGGPGPRYTSPMLPYLVVPVAIALARLTGARRAIVTGVGIVSMGLIVVTYELADELLIGHLENIRQFGVNPTIYTMAIGPLGWLLHAITVIAALAVLRTAWSDRADAEQGRASAR